MSYSQVTPRFSGAGGGQAAGRRPPARSLPLNSRIAAALHEGSANASDDARHDAAADPSVEDRAAAQQSCSVSILVLRAAAARSDQSIHVILPRTKAGNIIRLQTN